MFHFLKRKKDPLARQQRDTEEFLPVKAPVPAQEASGFCINANALSDVGCVRSNNEDNYLLGKDINEDSADCSTHSISAHTGDWFFAGVFDGMGGGEMGELASRDTARILQQAVEAIGTHWQKSEVDRQIRTAFLEANNRIVELQKEYKIFGTTGTVLCTNGNEFKLYHLGDSRAYLVRQPELMQLTKDQTLAQMKLEVGMYRQDDPAAEADKHKLTEYIGRDWTGQNLRPVESRWIPIQENDSVLLCSDGLYDMCTNEQIAGILWQKKTMDEKNQALIRSARDQGGEDNITSILIAFTG